MVSELHKKKPKKKKSRTTVMRRVRKFLSESDNLKDINRQRKNSDTSGLIDVTLIEEIMAQIPQISNRNTLKTLTILRKKLPKKLFNSVKIPCVIGSEHSQSLLLLELCDILGRCASEQMKII